MKEDCTIEIVRNGEGLVYCEHGEVLNFALTREGGTTVLHAYECSNATGQKRPLTADEKARIIPHIVALLLRRGGGVKTLTTRPRRPARSANQGPEKRVEPKKNPPCDFEYLKGYTCFRPAGQISFEEAVHVISQAISLAAVMGIKHLLVDTTGLTGFGSPSAFKRFFMAEEWAKNSRGLRLCVVARPEHIDPLRFGVLVARERGLLAEAFTSEPEAVEWILDPDSE